VENDKPVRQDLNLSYPDDVFLLWRSSLFRWFAYSILMFAVWILFLIFWYSVHPVWVEEFRKDSPKVREEIVRELIYFGGSYWASEHSKKNLNAVISAIESDDLVWWERLLKGDTARDRNVNGSGVDWQDFDLDDWQRPKNVPYVTYEYRGTMHPTPGEITTALLSIPAEYKNKGHLYEFYCHSQQRKETGELLERDPLFHDGQPDLRHAMNVFYAKEPEEIYDTAYAAFRYAGWKPIVLNNQSRYWSRWIWSSNGYSRLSSDIELMPNWIWWLFPTLPILWVWRSSFIRVCSISSRKSAEAAKKISKVADDLATNDFDKSDDSKNENQT
jgi:hypothetical protein